MISGLALVIALFGQSSTKPFSRVLDSSSSMIERLKTSMMTNQYMNPFIHRSCNAFAEEMNSLIQTAKRKARGFRTYYGFRTMIFLAFANCSFLIPDRFLAYFPADKRRAIATGDYPAQTECSKIK